MVKIDGLRFVTVIFVDVVGQLLYICNPRSSRQVKLV